MKHNNTVGISNNETDCCVIPEDTLDRATPVAVRHSYNWQIIKNFVPFPVSSRADGIIILSGILPFKFFPDIRKPPPHLFKSSTLNPSNMILIPMNHHDYDN